MSAPNGAAGGPAGHAAERSTVGRNFLRRALWILTVMAINATAGFAFHRVFTVGALIPVVASACAGPAILSNLLSWRRPVPLWLSIIVTLTGWLGTVVAVLFRGDVGSGLASVIGEGLKNAWTGILTTLLPAPASPDLLVLPHALVWVSTFAGTEIALRTRTRALPALPAVGVLGVAILLGVDGPGSNLYFAAGLVALTVVLVAVRGVAPGVRRRAPADSPAASASGGGRLGWLVMALPAAAAVGLVAMLGGPYLPRSGQEYDPREYVKAPPPQQRQAISPLDEVSAWLGAPGNVMFSVTASQPENWQIAVLNHFDGVTWTSTDDFVAAGARIPGAPGSRATRVAQRYTLGQLPGVWLPVADRPTSLSGVNADVDPASGAVTAATATFQGEKYSVVSKVRDYSAQQLADAVPATDAAANAAQGLPAVTTTGKQESPVTWFSRLTQRVVNGYSSPFQRAAAIQAWLQSDAKYSVKALPGHTYSQLEYFLATSKVGTSEQFACAFAVMARSIGLPTRVVVGFRPGSEVNGTWVVESGDVLVWPEIDFTGLGWVPFSPTPASADKSLKLNTVPTGVTQKKIQQAEKSAAAKTPGAGKGPNPTPHPRSSRPGHHHAGLPAWVYGSAAAGLVVVVYVSGALLVPVLRRRRRRRGSPAAQVRGAWRQSLESLRQVGLPDASTWTAEEVAAFGAGRVGADVHLTSLATLVNRAGYAAAPPSGAAADSAWRHADAVGVSVTRRTPWPRRVLRRLHPRSLNPRS